MAEFDGLPSVRCALFCAIAAVVEDVPQLTVQLLYANRTTGITNLGELSWQLKLSLAMSTASLLFRVMFRCFVAVVRKFQAKESEPRKDPPLMPLYLKFDDPQHWDRSYAETLKQQHRLLPVNDKGLRRRDWRMCWVGSGEEIKSTSTLPAVAPCPDGGGFVYLDDCGDMFSFECLGGTRNKGDSSTTLPEGLGPLEVLRVGKYYSALHCTASLLAAARCAVHGWLEHARHTASYRGDLSLCRREVVPGFETPQLPK